jgi:predicted PurR-regulated permease PerM
VPEERNRQFFERAIGLALIASLAAACVAITAPFIIPMLWGTILAVSTWPLYRRLRDALGGHRKTAATIMATLLLLVMASPIALLIASLADNADAIGALVGDLRNLERPSPPAWLATLPVVGPAIDAFWRQATANVGGLLEQAQPYVAGATGWLLARGADLGLALLEFLVAIVIAGILYVTGEPAMAILRRFVGRIGNEEQVALLDLAGRTIRGVAIGVIGTALVQGTVATVGLLVAGTPAPVLLGFAVFMTAVVQLPTAVTLLPVAGWFFWHGQTWQAVFLSVWALAVVNTIDNFVRPVLISQGANLPFLLIVVGVVGGLLTWGFIGIFLGATLLAVGYTLFRNWLDDDRYSRPWPVLVAGERGAVPAKAAAAEENRR